jgi:hypothetical protein
VHKALEEMGASRGRGTALDALRGAHAAALVWPDGADLERILLDAAHAIVRDEAIALASFAHALARRARAFVLEALRADAADGGPAVLGVEVRGVFRATGPDGSPREISFEADRVDRCGAGLLLTDYKTGRPPGGDSPDPKRHADALRLGIARGELLQAALYAEAAGASSSGRYLYLRPALQAAVRELPAVAAEPRARLEAALATLLGAWDAGAFTPRLREPQQDQEPFACRGCEVKEACARGDSGVRLRLGDWAAGPPRTEACRAAQALWRLPEVAA